jgi:hypothetical protein
MVLFSLVAVTLLIGTIFYHRVEGWRFLDSLYYCVITLMTVGYGDFTPKTDAGKMFTIVFLIAGAGIILGFVNVIAEHARNSDRINNIIRKREELLEVLNQKKAEIKKINKKLNKKMFNKKLITGNFFEKLDKNAEEQKKAILGK